MQTMRLPTAIGLVLLSASGCDAKAGDDYEGESLLALRGSVVLDDSTAPPNLVPALAFHGPKDILHFLDVEVEGQFPAKFRLDVLAPPPDAALLTKDNSPDDFMFIDGPSYAIADITAVLPDHAPTRPTSSFTRQTWCEPRSGDPAQQLPTGRTTTVAEDAPMVCFDSKKACAVDGSACFEELSRCEAYEKNCTVFSRTGDERVYTTAYYAGNSENYRVLYLTADAAKGSVLSQTYGGGEALSRGYHLIDLGQVIFGWDPITPTFDDLVACQTGVGAALPERFGKKYGRTFNDMEEVTTFLAIRIYNAQHGTHFTSKEELTSHLTSFGDEVEGLAMSVSKELLRESKIIERDLGCIAKESRFRAVGEPGAREIQVVIGIASEPLWSTPPSPWSSSPWPSSPQ